MVIIPTRFLGNLIKDDCDTDDSTFRSVESSKENPLKLLKDITFFEDSASLLSFFQSLMQRFKFELILIYLQKP